MKTTLPVTSGTLTVTIGVLLVFALTIFYVDPFLLQLMGLAAVVWIGPPLLVLGLLLLIYARIFRRSYRSGVQCVTVSIAFACIVGLAIPLNHLVMERAVATAKKYPEKVAPFLEEYRTAHGGYPESLELIKNKPSVPRLLRRSYGYRSNGNSYEFTFPQPGGLIDTWNYYSNTASWSLST
jgi:hypothetical protein